MRLVMKFGGTSVGSAEAIRRTANLIIDAQSDWSSVVVVVSAMSGVTDLLLEGAHAAVADKLKEYEKVVQTIRNKHTQAISELFSDLGENQQVTALINEIISRFEALCKAVMVLGELTPRALDAISSMGEKMSARVLAAYLRVAGVAARAVDATELIVTDEAFQAAVPLIEQTIERTQAGLYPLLDAGVVPVITGFIGATKDGIVTTLGRGGSDYSAALLGQAILADEVWIWTDVDGVMTADPRLVAAARSIRELSYREVAELAFYGAKVLHPKTIRPVIENNISLRIKNTFNPEHPGTQIVPESRKENGEVKAVTAIRDLSLINVEGKGMLGVPGIAARTFGAVARSSVSVLLISQASSEQSICFAIPANKTDWVISSLEQEFADEVGRRDVDRIWAHRPVAIVTVVGAGMRGTYGIAGRIFGALGDSQVNIIAIAQGSSECSISLVVEDRDAGRAEEAIHRLILAT